MASVPHPLKSLRTTRRLALALVITLALASGVAAITLSAQQPSSAAAAQTPPRATMFSVVDADGTLARHNRGGFTLREGIGGWSVDFAGDVNGCIYLAVPGDVGTTNLGEPTWASVGQTNQPVPGELRVFTWTTSGSKDAPFHLTVYCDPTSTVAAVHADGRKWGGNTLAKTKRLREGDYAVSFARVVRNCAFVASRSVLGSDFRELTASTITVAAGVRTGTVRVHTMDSAGAPIDSAFHVAVICDPSAPTAVVAGDGTLVRGANVRHAERVSTGTYWVQFNRTGSGCSYSATVGEPGVGAIPDPVTITTATYSGTHDAVSVEIMNGSGAYMDEPFHLVLSC